MPVRKMENLVVDPKVYRHKKEGKRGFRIKKWTPEMIQKALDRKSVVLENGCIVWTGYSNGPGKLKYGNLWIYGANQKTHRLSYELNNGRIPKGMVIDHLCRNTLCLNPKHLEVVTLKENLLRGISFSAVNARKTHCNRGHKLSGKNLSPYVSYGRTCLACERYRQTEAYKKERKLCLATSAKN